MKYPTNELTHHGIEGQKWGVRRFQNEDGTLTAAGRDRYLVGKERAEEYRKIKKEEAAKMEKRNPVVNRVNQELSNLKRDFDLDDNGNRTWKTNPVKYTEQQIKDAESQYRALQKTIARDREAIKAKAGEAAMKKLVEKYGEQSLKDMEYYHQEDAKRNARTGRIVAGIIAAVATLPIISLFIRRYRH